MTSRREPATALALCVAGASLVLLAAGRPWASALVEAAAPLPARRLSFDGADLAPSTSALGLVGLAGAVAVLATRRWGRVVTGVLIALAGAGVVTAAVLVRADVGSAVRGPTADALGVSSVEPVDAAATAWPWATAAGGALLAAGGVLTLVRGPRWAGMSRRYEPPAAASPPATPTPGRQPGSPGEGGPPEGDPAPAALWDALDRGEDPTSRR